MTVQDLSPTQAPCPLSEALQGTGLTVIDYVRFWKWAGAPDVAVNDVWGITHFYAIDEAVRQGFLFDPLEVAYNAALFQEVRRAALRAAGLALADGRRGN
ncbi:hypothetical protein [Bifidobacterium cebidarum]|uniref:Uncharacterized protein n=1 Tax=Bifidobacterium cebidarum TaxID=2650773 RepID=A0A6I1GMF4_9BIFI|nr:hypothetical protein [Bifidobacterium cebidarum]KAB7789228.1 hypothetical protein F7D08_0180 [Bifidobacterium cebidarum]